jgi:hypothetical protein
VRGKLSARMLPRFNQFLAQHDKAGHAPDGTWQGTMAHRKIQFLLLF